MCRCGGNQWKSDDQGTPKTQTNKIKWQKGTTISHRCLLWHPRRGDKKNPRKMTSCVVIWPKQNAEKLVHVAVMQSCDAWFQHGRLKNVRQFVTYTNIRGCTYKLVTCIYYSQIPFSWTIWYKSIYGNRHISGKKNHGLSTVNATHPIREWFCFGVGFCLEMQAIIVLSTACPPKKCHSNYFWKHTKTKYWMLCSDAWENLHKTHMCLGQGLGISVQLKKFFWKRFWYNYFQK